MVTLASTAEEPHTFIGLQVAGFGLSLVHVAAGEELLYLSLDRLTADYVQSKQSATTELRLLLLDVVIDLNAR